MKQIFNGFLTCLLLSSTALASNELAQSFTLDGQLMLSGTTTALTDAAAVLTIDILDPSKTCVLYEETQTVNTVASEGYFSIQIGSLTGAAKRTSSDPGLSMVQIFQNTTAVTATSASGSTCAGNTYTPAADAVRYFRITVTPSSTNVADVLSPDTTIDAAPMAMVAQTLQGYAAADFIAKAGLPTCSSGTFLSYDGTNLSCAGVSGTNGGTVTSITAGTGLTGGTITASGTLALATSGVTAGTYGSASAVPVVTVDSYGRVTGVTTTSISGGTVTSVSGTAPISVATGTSTPVISISQATSSANGYLSSADWNTFNSKMSSSLASGDIFVGNASGGAAAVAMSGDATLSNAGALVLATVATAGTYAKVVVNAKGLVTGSSSLALTDLPSIATGTVLANVSGSAGTPTAATPSSVLDTISNVQGTILYRSSSGWSALAPGTSGYYLQTQGASANPQWAQVTSSGGSVTSVGLSLPSMFTVTNSPVTTSGTLTATLASQTANTFFAAPNGSAGSPTFRAIASADLPTIPVSGGGTGLTTGTSGGIPYYSASTTMASSAALAQYGVVYGGGAESAPAATSAGTSGYVLTSNGGGSAPSFQQVSLSSGVTGTLPITQGGTGSTTASAARTALGTAASGANADITSTADLTSISSTTSTITLAPTGNLNLSPSTAVVSSAVYEAPLGSASAPSYTNSTNPNTGMYFPTSTSLGFATSGANVVTMLSNGDVGIGTTAPAYTLDVAGAIHSSTGGFVFPDGTTMSSAGSACTPYTTGSSVCLGSGLQSSSATGSQNSAIGIGPMTGAVTGSQNSALGRNSMTALTSGSNNAAFGSYALDFLTTGNQNAALGDNAGLYANGSNNVFVGQAAGNNSGLTGSNNVFVGQAAGTNQTTGSNNIIIGQAAQVPSATASNQLSIGNWIYGTGGSIGIGTTAPAYKLDVAGDVNVSGSFRVNGTAIGSSSGTVTSVGMSLPSMFTVTNSPVTTNGTLTATLASQTANTFFAAPNGSAGSPTFRAIASADLPTIPVSGGGTGATTASAARTNLSAAASGANADITSTSVLTSISSTTSAITIAPTGNLNLSPSTAVVSSAVYEAPLGTAAAPSYTNSTNPNTGIYFPTSTSLGFSTAGTNAMTILANREVGIGTTAPSGNLDIENGSDTATLCLNGTCTTSLSSGGSSQWTSASGGIEYSGSPVIVGAGEAGTPSAVTLRGPAASGTNITGADMTIAASNGTGSGGSGNIIFQTAPVSASGTVSYVSTSQGSNSNTNSLSWSHTVTSGSNLLLLVNVSIAGTATVSGITFNGTAMTQLTTISGNGSSTGATYYMINPPVTTANIVVSMSNWGGVIGQAINISGANQSTPFETASTGGNTWGTTASLSPTSALNELVVDFLISAGAGTINSGQTAIFNTEIPGQTVYAASSYKSGAAGSTTVSYTLGSGNNYGYMAVGIKSAASSSSSDSLTEAMRIAPSGYVGIANSSPAYALSVGGDVSISSSNALRFGSTSVCTSSGCTSSSDRRLKENIKPLQGSLDKILKLDGVQFDYKDKKQFGDHHQVGVIAQDTEKIYPEVVITDSKTGLKAVAYDHLVAPLIEAVKSLYGRIVKVEKNQDRNIATVEALKTDVQTLKDRAEKAEKENAELKARLDRLEKAMTSK